MNLDRRIKIQLAVFTVIAVIAAAVMILHYINAPAVLFGVGRYTVTLQLQRAAGLYPSANVSYRGTEVGRVKSVQLSDSGVRAVLQLKSGITIPSRLRAEIHSQTAIGEQYVDLLPRTADSPPLKDGDVIAEADTWVPPDIDTLLNSTNRGLAAIPQDNLKTAINESYAAVGGLSSELTRLVTGSTQLALDADKNLNSITALIDQSPPVLDSQTASAAAIQAWAAHLAVVTNELATHDDAVAGLLHTAGPATEQARKLLQRLQPALPTLLANLVSIGQVALVYQPAVEQLLVLLPQGVANVQGMMVANQNTKQDYRGLYLDFKLNLNLPPVCNTGFLPPQQQRVPTFEDHPDRPQGDLYCRVPQDFAFGVRGARNYPCLTAPGKRAPTVKMCDSKEQYVPLNDGFNWKGDPNATTSGQAVPQLPPGSAPDVAAHAAAAPPIASIPYNPATGSYIGPDGRQYTQSDLAQSVPKNKTWQAMMLPPGS